MNEIFIKRAELGIIHDAIVQQLGYDDGTNADILNGKELLIVHEKKLKYLKKILKTRKEYIEYSISNGDNISVTELTKINKKIEMFEGEL